MVSQDTAQQDRAKQLLGEWVSPSSQVLPKVRPIGAARNTVGGGGRGKAAVKHGVVCFPREEEQSQQRVSRETDNLVPTTGLPHCCYCAGRNSIEQWLLQPREAKTSTRPLSSPGSALTFSWRLPLILHRFSHVRDPSKTTSQIASSPPTTLDRPQPYALRSTTSETTHRVQKYYMARYGRGGPRGNLESQQQSPRLRILQPTKPTNQRPGFWRLRPAKTSASARGWAQLSGRRSRFVSTGPAAIAVAGQSTRARSRGQDSPKPKREPFGEILASLWRERVRDKREWRR